MLTNRKLIKHPTKDGSFIETHNDYQIGHSLYSGGHIFNFSSKSIDVSEILSSYNPITDDVKISTTESIRLELKCDHPYSYMGSDRRIDRYTMWIEDLSEQKLKSPHITVLPLYDDVGGEIFLGIGLYVEQKQLQKIREDFLSEKYNYIDVNFSTDFDYDLVFKSSSHFNYPSNDFLKSFDLDQKKYGRVNTPYPYKILQKGDIDIGDGIRRYEGQPITNFDIKLGKKIMNDKVSFEEDPNIEKIRLWMTYELLTLNGDEDNET